MIFISVLSAIFLFDYVYGFKILNPYEYSWMLSGDASLHFFGFNFFNQEPWHWPLGFIEKFNDPRGTSVVYTDSVPWLALFCKTLGIQACFQYHGFWILFCFLMQAVSGFYLVKEALDSGDQKEKRQEWKCLVGSWVALTLPMLIFRSFEGTKHYSLLAHFLVIAAVILCIRFLKTKATHDFHWWSLIFLSIGIHFYFTVMIAFLYLLTFFTKENGYKIYLFKKRIRFILLAAAATLFAALLLGYFIIPPSEARDFGFGLFSANLDTWFNSDGYSFFGLKFPTRSVSQREGFQYLGMGVLLSMVLILSIKSYRAQFIQGWQRLRGTPLAYLFYFLFCLMLSRRPSLFNFELPIVLGLVLFFVFTFYILTQTKKRKVWKCFVLAALALLFFTQVGEVMRSSGRLGWVMVYFLIFFLFTIRVKSWVLVGLAGLQLLDVFPLVKAVREQNRVLFKNESFQKSIVPLDAFFLAHSQQWKRIIFLDKYTLQRDAFQWEALKYHLPIGPVYLARSDKAKEKLESEKLKKDIHEGQVSKDVIYVVDDFELLKGMNESTRSKLKIEVQGDFKMIYFL